MDAEEIKQLGSSDENTGNETSGIDYRHKFFGVMDVPFGCLANVTTCKDLQCIENNGKFIYFFFGYEDKQWDMHVPTRLGRGVP